jgi:hypothetical protein
MHTDSVKKTISHEANFTKILTKKANCYQTNNMKLLG